MAVKFYEGRRIYFRPIELDDEPRLRAWINDPRSWATLGRALPINGVREREWIESLYKSPTDVALAIVVRDGDRHIGNTGLHGIAALDRKAEFGVFIGDVEYRGRGFGSEATALMVRYAFEELNLHRVALSVFADNPRAARAYEKAGFVREGIERESAYRNGRWHDIHRYGVLRDEWQKAGRPGCEDAEAVGAATSEHA